MRPFSRKGRRAESWAALVLVAALCAVPWGAGCGGSGNGPADAGTDAGSDGGPAHLPGHPGAACRSDADCLFDGTCLPAYDGFPGGYCLVAGCTPGSCPEGSTCFEFQSGSTGCLAACTDSSQCRQADGYVCDEDDTCWPAPGMVSPGGPCAYNDQCSGGAGATCIEQIGFLDGYCIAAGCDASSCPPGSACREVLGAGSWACIPLCDSDADCRDGYVCVVDPGTEWDQSCIPGCEAGGCPEPFTCVEDEMWSGHLCEDIRHLCSPENTSGDCEAGFVCSDAGACEPFVCDDTVFEPNEDAQQARPLPLQDTGGMQICSGDEDWFNFTPDQPAVLHQIGIDYNLASGDLDIRLFDSGLAMVENPRMIRDYVIPVNGWAPVNNESFALLAAPGSDAYFVRVFRQGNSVNDYTLLSKTVPYQDGPVCADLHSPDDCLAMTDGEDDPSRLIPFPAGHPLDPFVGEGIFFGHGLGGETTTHLPASKRWSRRELIMLVRNAVHEVQQAFPGTTPLAVGEVGLSDGHTPAGHPNHTHDRGANVDLAYYILPEYHRQWGNIVYRQICCDAQFLADYSCVDTDQSSAEYGICVPGSENTHIVDIPRTALLLAKLTVGNRLRAAGVEATLRPELDAEFGRLLNDGLITQEEHDAILTKIRTAAEHPSWIWHFHHIHVGLCKRECEE